MRIEHYPRRLGNRTRILEAMEALAADGKRCLMCVRTREDAIFLSQRHPSIYFCHTEATDEVIKNGEVVDD